MKSHLIIQFLLIPIVISRADEVRPFALVKEDQIEPSLLIKEDATKSVSEKRSVAPSDKQSGTGNNLSGSPTIKALTSNMTGRKMGRAFEAVDNVEGKAPRKLMNWPKSQQIGWIEVRPYKGMMYAQRGINGKLCRLGPEGPMCSEEEDGGDDTQIRNITERVTKYDGGGYDTDCDTGMLNGLRIAVEAATVSESTKRMVLDQNVMIRRAFIARALGKINTTVDQEPKNGFMLFDKMMEIVHNICPESTLPQTFLDSLTFYLKQLHASVSPNRTPYINDGDFTWISNILAKCDARTKSSYRATRDKLCRAELTPVAHNGEYVCPGPPLDENFHYHEKVYDPALDAIWHAFTAIQYLCFEDFAKESSRMFHHFGTAIMDLFTAPIKLKWTSQIEVKFTRLFQRLLGPFYQIYMSNLERCVVYIKDKTSFDNLMIPRFYSFGSVRYLAS